MYYIRNVFELTSRKYEKHYKKHEWATPAPLSSKLTDIKRISWNNIKLLYTQDEDLFLFLFLVLMATAMKNLNANFSGFPPITLALFILPSNESIIRV